jgi:hypothetical protein
MLVVIFRMRFKAWYLYFLYFHVFSYFYIPAFHETVQHTLEPIII